MKVSSRADEWSASGNAQKLPTLRPGAMIANAKGVPGSLGWIACTLHNQQRVLLTCWHVLFGRDGSESGDMFLVSEAGGASRRDLIGNTLYGKVGIVNFGDRDYYVDCAVASSLAALDPQLYAWGDWSPVSDGYDDARPGDLVIKTGAATGVTSGVIVDVKYSCTAWINGGAHPAPQQLLVRSTNGQAPFSAEGDSGAVLRNGQGKVVGLLWGTTSRGEGVACPIMPVLYTLNITLERLNP